MPVKENKIIDYLAKHYGSSISKRALWTWCGGVETDVDYDLPPLDGWGMMWAQAEDGKAPTRIGLVREMLFDSPGEKRLLDYLAELAAERYTAEKEIADFFLFLLERTGGTENQLPALLYLLQDMPPDCILATTAPAMQSARDDNLYAELDQILPKFVDRRVAVSPTSLVQWIEFYLEYLADEVSTATVTQADAEQLKACLATVKTVVDAATPPEDGVATDETPFAKPAVEAAAGDEIADELEERRAVFEEAIQALKGQIEKLQARPAEPGARFFTPAVKVIVSLLELLNDCGLGGEAVLLQFSAVEPVRAALWATR